MRKITSSFIVLLLLGLFAGNTAHAQKDGYNLKFTVKGIKAENCFLAYHYGKKQFITDTVQANEKGFFEFQGEEKLPGGIYLVVLPNQSWFEIVLDQEQYFSASTSVENVIEDMKFKGSEENTVFYKYQLEMKQYSETAGKLKKEREAAGEDEAKLKEIEAKEKKLNADVQAARKKFINDYPEMLFPRVLDIMEDPKIPEAPKDEDGNPDKTWQFRWYKAHYWDKFDFKDERMIRTPIFEPKLKRYFKDLVIMHPDTVIMEADNIIGRTMGNKEMFKFTLITVFNQYVNSKVMGMDKFYVHMAKNYYLKPELCDWADTSFTNKMERRVKILEPVLIGKTFPNLVLQDTSGNNIFINKLPAKYTVLFFYDYNCGHCKKEAPKIHDVYKKYEEDGVMMVGACIKRDEKEFKKFIKEKELTWINAYDKNYRTDFKNWYDVYSTPVVYLLDEKKEIIAKRIDAKGLERLLDHFINGTELKPESLKEGETSEVEEGE